jgi:predicted MFS family arabinose efflux permease
MASQALLVVLAPTMVAVAADLDVTVAVIGQARSITAAVAVAASVFLIARVGVIGIARLITGGGLLAAVACLGVAVAPTVAVFLTAHVLLGLAFAALLTGGFSGVAAFAPDRRTWAMGYVAGANALAWIVVNPAVGAITDWASWRVAQAVPALIALLAAGTASRAAPVPPGGAGVRFRDLLSERPARGWLAAELLAYAAWTALLTYVGAFFIESLGVSTALVGWILAAGAAAYFLAATQSGALARVATARRLVATAAVVMGALAVIQVNVTGSVVLGVAVFCAIGLAAGVRTPASGALGLGLLPRYPGAIMAVRTAATQLGYLIGAVAGGAVIGLLDYGALGLGLAGGMTVSALLVLRVPEPGENV